MLPARGMKFIEIDRLPHSRTRPRTRHVQLIFAYKECQRFMLIYWISFDSPFSMSALLLSFFLCDCANGAANSIKFMHKLLSTGESSRKKGLGKGKVAVKERRFIITTTTTTSCHRLVKHFIFIMAKVSTSRRPLFFSLLWQHSLLLVYTYIPGNGHRRVRWAPVVKGPDPCQVWDESGCCLLFIK